MNPSPETVPAGELSARHKTLQRALRDASPPIDAALILQNVDLYYYAGTMQTAHLIVPADGSPRLLVRQVLERARRESALEDIEPLRSLRGLADEICTTTGSPLRRVGMELDVVPAATVEKYRSVLGDAVEIVDISASILASRAVKSSWEIGEITRSAAILEAVLDGVREHLQPGRSTYELQARLNASACRAGHCGAVRLRGLNAEAGIGVVVSGEPGAEPGHSMFPIGGRGPHAVAPGAGGHDPILRGVPVAIDYLANATGYHADCTRMAVVGEMPDEARGILEHLAGILRWSEQHVRVGAVPSAIWEEVLSQVEAAGYSQGFMGVPGFAVRFLGHGVGLEVNETPVLAPRFDSPLVEGNVLAIEPKFTHPSLGVIGLENTYVVRDSGLENLTRVSEATIEVDAS